MPASTSTTIGTCIICNETNYMMTTCRGGGNVKLHHEYQVLEKDTGTGAKKELKWHWMECEVILCQEYSHDLDATHCAQGHEMLEKKGSKVPRDLKERLRK